MKTKARELDPGLYEKITALCDRGNAKCEEERFREALDDYGQALALIPQPIEDWEASTWVLAALGDCHFLLGDFKAAHHDLTRAMYCPGGIGNTFLHLRLGEVQYELGNQERAKDELARAYMGGGPEAFEHEDPRYLAFLRRFMKGI
jgi:tetratricopeptide (TPR) repeat protein